MVTGIIIANNSDLMILGMKTILESSSKNQVIGTAQSKDALLSLLEKQNPHVIFMSENLYNVHLLTTLESLSQLQPMAKTIVIGSLADGLFIRDLFHAGGHGYLYTSDDLCECLDFAVTTVLHNRKYLSPTANAEYLVAMQSPQRDWHLDSEARAVLQMLAHGHRACEIAEALKIDTRRVYFVRQKLRKRFNAQTNEHPISVAAGEGFIYPS